MYMNLRRKGYPPQSIRPRAAGGQAGWSIGLFFLLFLAVLLRGLIQLEIYRTTSLYLEDALAASNLASAVVDVEEYGISHNILIADPDQAYETYRWAVRENLNLDYGWRGREGIIVQGPVRIENYTVYNVAEGKVMIYSYDKNGVATNWQESLGNVVAPNGKEVVATSVYSEIRFRVRGFLGTDVEAYKGNLADVVR